MANGVNWRLFIELKYNTVQPNRQLTCVWSTKTLDPVRLGPVSGSRLRSAPPPNMEGVPQRPACTATAGACRARTTQLQCYRYSLLLWIRKRSSPARASCRSRQSAVECLSCNSWFLFGSTGFDYLLSWDSVSLALWNMPRPLPLYHTQSPSHSAVHCYINCIT
jgi:hypothetical protein